MNNFQQNWQIVRQLTLSDFKLRYSGSYLGYLWSLLKPLGLFAVLYVVFAKLLRFGGSVPNYPTYLLIGIILWSFFAEVTGNGMQSIVNREGLIKKIYFPRIIVVIVSSFSALINLCLNLVALIPFMIYFHVNVFHPGTFMIFLYIFELWLLGFGVALFLSALFVRYRDLSYIWEVFLQAFFYLNPIIYPLSMIGAKYSTYLMLNPLSQIIMDFRRIFISFDDSFIQHSYYPWFQITTVLLIAVGGYLYFNHHQKRFAEEI